MDSTVSWMNDTSDMPDLLVNEYEIPLLGAFLFYFVQVKSKLSPNIFVWPHYVTWRYYCILLDIKVFVWHRLCRRSHGKHTRHLRRPALHKNANSHQFVHFEFGRGRRMFSHWHPIHYDDDGSGILAIWQRHVQGETSIEGPSNFDEKWKLMDWIFVSIWRGRFIWRRRRSINSQVLCCWRWWALIVT